MLLVSAKVTHMGGNNRTEVSLSLSMNFAVNTAAKENPKETNG